MVLRSGGTRAVVLQTFAASIQRIISSTTLHEWAGKTASARPLRGRDTAYATLLDDTAVVVRHSRHGGLLATITKDYFLAPTRAPHELDVSMRLRAAGVPTPEIVAYAVYEVVPGIARADVITREIDAEPLQRVEDAEGLLRAMSDAGAVHPDLNARNVLVDGPIAYVLDVDRVYFLEPGDSRVDARNRARLLRSARKLGL